MFYIYILQSLKDSKLYIGYTSNLKRRLKEHKTGGSVSTKKDSHLDFYIMKLILMKRTLEEEKDILKLKKVKVL
jgi:putative endonuclease